MSSNNTWTRYQRQIILKNFGAGAQEKLLAASVLVVGVGGLGCPVLQYLCGAGVGRIGMIDDDVVALSNLHRQILFETRDVGNPKVLVAGERLKQMNPAVIVDTYNERLTQKNALSIIGRYDLVIDGSDNFSTRYLVNDACVHLRKPLLLGAISGYEGQIAVLNNVPAEGETRPANYRDIFPWQPEQVMTCNEAGVLNVLPGLIGTLMATEAIKLISGMGYLLNNQLYTYNLLTHQSYIMEVAVNAKVDEMIPRSDKEFEEKIYAPLSCAADVAAIEIDIDAFKSLLPEIDIIFVDVREAEEMPEPKGIACVNIPSASLKYSPRLQESEFIVLFCWSGVRSLAAARELREIYVGKKIYSLKGGLQTWIKMQEDA